MSTLPLGALTGSFFASIPLNYLGRKPTLILSGCVFTLSFALIAAAEINASVPMILVGRIIGGLAVGIASPTAPIYISEISSPDYRGTFGCFPALLLAVGILMGYTVGSVLPWHYLACFMVGPSVLLVFGMTFLPESPLWLYRNKKPEHVVLASLTWLRGGSQELVRREFSELQKASQALIVNNNSKDGEASEPGQDQPSMLQSFFSRPCLYPLFLSLVLMLVQIWCGVNVLIFKTVDIFAAVGSSIDKYVATGIVGVVNLFATAVSVAIVDKTGRRMLLLISCGTTCLAQAVLGACFFMGEEEVNALAGWLPLASVVVAFIGYAVGLAAIPFLIMGEMLPARFRSVCGPISTTFNLTILFFLLKFFDQMTYSMEYHGVFWLYAVVNAFGFIFIFFLLPETKGKTLDEIEKIFTRKE